MGLSRHWHDWDLPLIRIEQLSFGYRKSPLYQDFNLCLNEPGVYGLFGRNGSGKSTLLLLLAGLLFPKGGRIDVHGHVPARRRAEFLREIYIVPEEFHLPNLRPDKLAQTQSVFYPNFSSESFAEYLRIFEVPPERSFEEMSLGQKKKAAVAFALATFTPVLLLDEPTNGLDIISRDQFKAIMARPEQRQRIGQDVHGAQQIFVVGSVGDGVVQTAVRRSRFFRRLCRKLICKQVLERVDFERGRLLAGKARCGALEHFAHRVQLEHLRLSELIDDEAARLVENDKAVRFQSLQRLAHGCSAHAQLIGDRGLAQALTWTQSATANRVTEFGIDELSPRRVDGTAVGLDRLDFRLGC